MVENYNSELKI